MVYVTAIIVVMVRQFRMLNNLEEDSNRLLVVNTSGDTEVESLRCGTLSFKLDPRLPNFPLYNLVFL